MTEGDNSGLSPEAKLARLGISEKSIGERMDILRVAISPEDLGREFRVRRLSCDIEQFLLPIFRPLYQMDEEIRRSVSDKLSRTGIPEAVIEQYILNYGDQPYMILHFEHEDIGLEVREGFIDRSQQVMLDALRAYLGFGDRNITIVGNLST